MAKSNTTTNSNDNVEIVTATTTSSATIWVDGTSALALIYLEEMARPKDPIDSTANSKPKSSDPPRNDDTANTNENSLVTNTAYYNYLALDMTQKDSIDGFFDRLVEDKNHYLVPYSTSMVSSDKARSK